MAESQMAVFGFQEPSRVTSAGSLGLLRTQRSMLSSMLKVSATSESFLEDDEDNDNDDSDTEHETASFELSSRCDLRGVASSSPINIPNTT